MATSKNNLCLILLLISILFLKPNFYLCLETISIDHSLSGDQTIVSQGGNFELGFQNPGNTSKYYISMWYKKVSTITIAWVANRETPVTDKFSSVLKIMKGNLILFDESQSPVWSTNCTQTTSNSTIALLRDDGNLVLLNEPNSKIPVWQSFDFPGNTWFPGGKLAYDKIMKTHQCLTSWKNRDDPSLGLYSISLDASTNQYFLSWNRTEHYWGSGTWNGHIFNLTPEMAYNFIFNFSYVDNENESYFAYSLNHTSIITQFIVDVSGQLRLFNWLEPSKEWNLIWSKPQQQCEVYAFCGPFSTCNSLTQPFCSCLLGFEPKSSNETNLGDYSSGCVRKTKLQCGNYSGANQKKDKFFVLANVKLPSNPYLVNVHRAFDCKSSCLNNCSCTAYAYGENKCLIWIGELLNIEQLLEKDGRGRTLNLKLSVSEFSSSGDNKGVVIGIVTGSGFVIVLFLCFVFLVILRRRRRSGAKTKIVEGSLVMFSYRDLQKATRSFSEKLGGGGFGSVFKGELSGSSIIAVKQLESISQGEKQFRNEVSTIGTVQHINLVRLRGFCSEGSNRLLVYDYMQNGSLDAHLFHEKNQKVLDWKTRYQITVGTARGLAYLHEECIDCIIHCDIKPENILLDDEFHPKLADFGLAKLVGRNFSRVLTTMRGTRGYLAPEWISGVAITTKADVYSFGMMVLEIVSGMRNSGHFKNGRFKYFPVWATWVVAHGGDVLSLLDHRLDRASVDIEGLMRMCRIACWCIQDEEADRPTMGHVVQVLEGVLDVSPFPIPSYLGAFIDDVDHEGECLFNKLSLDQISEYETMFQ